MSQWCQCYLRKTPFLIYIQVDVTNRKAHFFLAPLASLHSPNIQKTMQRDSTLLTSGPFSLGSNDPLLLLVYGTTTGHTGKQPPTKSSRAAPPAPKTVMKRVKSLDFYAQHVRGSSMSLEKASKFSSQEWPCFFKAAPQQQEQQQGGPQSSSRSLNDNALVRCQEEDDENDDEYLAKHSTSDSLVSRMMNARRFPLFVSLVMLFVVSWSHAAASSSSHQQQQQQHGGGALASAALSSITSTLSPILPFTGGIDLRRRVQEEEEELSWLDSIKTRMVQVQMAFFQTNDENDDSVLEQIPRGGGGGGTTTTTMVKQQQHPQERQRHVVPTSCIISHAKPFVSQDVIAELTLDDITFLFKYAMNPNEQKVANDNDDDESKMKPIITEALNAVVHKSRGFTTTTTHNSNAASTTATTTTTTGSMDALYFCAVLRLFAEWRIVRQVPPGYKGYAVGMNLGHKDVVQNLAKLETAIHHYMAVHPPHTSSPTLRQLLEFEISIGTHGGKNKLPRLHETSAAMGLLWVRRQLHYQTRVFDNILKVPSSAYPTCQTAVAHAYTTVYGMYHGWAVQKIFQYSFQAAPQVTEIYKSMNPTLLQDVTCQARRRQMMIPKEGESSTVDDLNNHTNNHTDKSNNNPIERWIHHVGGEWNKLCQHVGGEWNKLVDNVVRVLDQDVSKPKEDADAATRVVVRGGSTTTSLDEEYSEEMEQFISQQMERDAHQRIARYLKQVEPLLEDLAGLFHELNMDDPSKV